MTITSEKILQKIKEANIKPEPRWHFLLKNSTLWFLFFVALIVGALSFSVVLEMLVYHDWDIYQYLHKTFLQYVMLSLPYLWIVSLACMSFVAYYNYKHTKGWYKHRIYRVVLASVGLSIGLGTGAFYLGAGEKIDKVFAEKIPSYEMMKMDKNNLWVNPEAGLLSGKIAEVKNENDFVIEDCKGRTWNVKKTSARIKSPKLKAGEVVKIIGKEKDQTDFEAEEIRDWNSKKSLQREEKKDEDEDEDETDESLRKNENCLAEKGDCDGD